MALIEGMRWRVQFDQANHLYYVRQWSGVFGDTDHIYEVHLPRGVEFYFLGRHRFDYLPRGTIDGGAFSEGAGFTIRLRSGRYEQVLTVLPVTGRVKVYDIQRLRG